MALFGSYLPGRKNRLFLALSSHRIAPVTSVSENVERDSQTGLLAKDSFAEVALEALKGGAAQEKPYLMSLLKVDGLDEFQQRLDKQHADDFLADISVHLQVHSVNGESAGRLTGNQFGLVHDASLDIVALEQSIVDRAQNVDPTGEGLAIETSTVFLEDDQVTDEDNARALLYTINKFSEQHGDFTISALSQGYKMMLDDTRDRITQFKKTIDAGKFDVVFQPIVDLKTRVVHHSEALVRFHDDEAGGSPFEAITFAEDVGVIGDFDLAMCRKVIDKIHRAKDRGDTPQYRGQPVGPLARKPGLRTGAAEPPRLLRRDSRTTHVRDHGVGQDHRSRDDQQDHPRPQIEGPSRLP